MASSSSSVSARPPPLPMGGSSSSSAPAPSSRPTSLAPALATGDFPPPVSEAEALLAGTGKEKDDGNARTLALRRWCDALRELLEEFQRGSLPEAPPVEEVWHWLAAAERLARCRSFAEHAALGELLAIVEASGAEGMEAVDRWNAAVRKLRKVEVESSWNARYLRVVEQPLRRLGTEEAVLQAPGALPQVVGTLLRSLSRVYCTSNHYREPRMAPLLHKVLKVLVGQAVNHLTPLSMVARPPRGFGEAMRTAGVLRDSFSAFQDQYFVNEAASAPSSGSDAKRPSTAPGRPNLFGGGGAAQLSARRTCGSSSSSSLAAADLGWWKATVRTSLEQAQHCRQLCDRQCTILEGCGRLVAALPALKPAGCGQLLMEAQSFIELHSGVRDYGCTADMLDLKRRAESQAKVAEVAERLQDILAAVEAAGVEVPQLSSDVADDVPAVSGHGDGPSLHIGSSGAVAEVFALPGGIDKQLGSSSGPVSEQRNPATSEDLQESIESVREELRAFSSQLDNMHEMITRKTPVNGHLRFRPPPRTSAACSSASTVEENSGSSEASDMTAALEVAKRSSWYHQPPSPIPEDVEVIEVNSKISITRKLDRPPSRPRTAHPCYSVTRNPEPPPGRAEDCSATHRPATTASCSAVATNGLADVSRVTAREVPVQEYKQETVAEIEDEHEDLKSGCVGASVADAEEALGSDDADDDGMFPTVGCSAVWRIT